jgi:hypothetical protein
MMPKMNLYSTAAEIAAATIKFTRSNERLETEAHKLACSVLAHVGEYGDIHVVSRFLASFSEMARVNAARAWFEEFGPVTFEGNEPKFVRGKKTRLGEAMDVKFWKFSKEGVYKPVDPQAELVKLTKRLKLDTKKTGTDHSVLLTALGALRVKINTPNVTVPAPLAITYQPAVH